MSLLVSTNPPCVQHPCVVCVADFPKLAGTTRYRVRGVWLGIRGICPNASETTTAPDETTGYRVSAEVMDEFLSRFEAGIAYDSDVMVTAWRIWQTSPAILTGLSVRRPISELGI